MDDYIDWSVDDLNDRLNMLDDILAGNPLNARANSEYKEVLNALNTRLRDNNPQQGEPT